MVRTVVLVTLLIGVIGAINFSSSSESCEDGGNGGGGRPGNGRPPGNGGGGGANGGCDADWKRFNRPSGGWCIRSFGGTLTQAAAEVQCKSYGATLSGLQNLEEARYAARSVLPVLGKASGSLWIGARRRSSCLGQTLTSACTTTSSFYWTDHSADGNAGFVWTDKQPDNAHNLKQDCVILTAASADLTVKNVLWPVGRLDDVGCVPNPADPSPRAISGYVCGKVARR